MIGTKIKAERYHADGRTVAEVELAFQTAPPGFDGGFVFVTSEKRTSSYRVSAEEWERLRAWFTA